MSMLAYRQWLAQRQTSGLFEVCPALWMGRLRAGQGMQQANGVDKTDKQPFYVSENLTLAPRRMVAKR